MEAPNSADLTLNRFSKASRRQDEIWNYSHNNRNPLEKKEGFR